jgi:hypothetical protein
MTHLGTIPGFLFRARAFARGLSRRVGWADIPFVGALLAVTFPAVAPPDSSLDSSWVTGLAWARQLNLPFGSTIDFTYGPWSILDSSAVFSGWMLACWLVASAISGCLLLFLVRATLRRRLGRLSTGLVILIVLTPALLVSPTFSKRVLLIAVAVAFVGFATGPTRRFEILIGVSAALSAVAVLDKFSNGLLAMGMTGLAALAVRGTLRQRILTVALAVSVYLVIVPTVWIGGGQHVGDFLPWLRASMELTLGYADAMAIEVPLARVGYLVVAFVVVLLLVHLRRGRHLAVAPVGSMVVVVVVIVIGMRLGFTRDSPEHQVQTFTLMALVALLAGVAFVRYRWAIATATIAVLAVFGASGSEFFTTVDPGLLARQAEQTVTTALSGSDRSTLADTATTAMQGQYALDPAILAAVEGRTVHVDPFAANVAWSYQLNWKPVPIIQSYSAYTAYLDQLNADSLALPDGPQSVIRGPLQAIDQRNPMWESPSYVEAMVCHFEVAVSTNRWLVLDRVDNRCSGESQISNRHVQPGETVQVPSATNDHTMVVARLTLDPDPLNSIATAIFKPLRRLEITTDANTYQLPRGEAGGSLVLRMPDSAGWPTAFGGGYTVPALSLNQGATIQFFAVNVQ